MSDRFPPQKDSELRTMAANASTKITAHPSDYGLSVGQATALASLSAAYATAYNLAIDPITRTKAKISAKNDARKLLADNLRDLNRFVQATKTVTDEKKIEIGFPVYSARRPIPAPSDPPVIQSVITNGRRTKIKLRPMDEERRGRPAGVQGAIIISFTGVVPPADTSQWRIEGLVTRTDFPIDWSPTIAAGSQVWVAAAWYSPRGLLGPACNPVSVAVGGGLSMTPEVADSEGAGTMREAA
jgi:hypothetical protein